MWKDKEYKYISSAWNKQHSVKELAILRLRMLAEKSVGQSCTVWEQVPQSAFFLAELVGYLAWFV